MLWHTSLGQKNGLCVKLFNKTTGFEPTKHPILHQLDKHWKKALFEKNKQLESLILLVSIHLPSPFIKSQHEVAQEVLEMEKWMLNSAGPTNQPCTIQTRPLKDTWHLWVLTLLVDLHPITCHPGWIRQQIPNGRHHARADNFSTYDSICIMGANFPVHVVCFI